MGKPSLMEEPVEVELYEVHDTVSGLLSEPSKAVKYLGHVYPHESGGYTITEISFCSMLLSDALDQGVADALEALAETCQQYAGEFGLDEVDDYLRATQPSFLPMRDVSTDTPTGVYWCRPQDM